MLKATGVDGFLKGYWFDCILRQAQGIFMNGSLMVTDTVILFYILYNAALFGS